MQGIDQAKKVALRRSQASKGAQAMTNETEIIKLKPSAIIAAKWNYKTDGTRAQIEKLKASIKRDKSAGIIAVRMISKKRFEIIDGNHRLKALQELKWNPIICENYGKISLAEAILIARRRNRIWFADDEIAFAKLYAQEIRDQIGIDELDHFMGESRKELEALALMSEIDWDALNDASDPASRDGVRTIKLLVDAKLFTLWELWITKVRKIYGSEQTEARAFEIALAEALNMPEDSLK